MPIYEYECPDCGEVIEEIRAVKDMMELTLCPKCGQSMEKKVSVASFTMDPWMGAD